MYIILYKVYDYVWPHCYNLILGILQLNMKTAVRKKESHIYVNWLHIQIRDIAINLFNEIEPQPLIPNVSHPWHIYDSFNCPSELRFFFFNFSKEFSLFVAVEKSSSRGRFEATLLHAEYIFMRWSLPTSSLKFNCIDASPWMKEDNLLAMWVLWQCGSAHRHHNTLLGMY